METKETNEWKSKNNDMSNAVAEVVEATIREEIDEFGWNSLCKSGKGLEHFKAEEQGYYSACYLLSELVV